jgi:hypothetical protein
MSVIWAGLMMCLAPLSHARNENLDFVLVNKTGYTLDEIYVSPAKSDDWGDDIMGHQIVPDGAQVNVKFHYCVKLAALRPARC